MAFQQGLSGLGVSSKAIDVISHNIANASTVGFKSSSAHFADVYAASLSGGGASPIGIGVSLSSVFQQFTQGNVTTTNNPLDISINGGGFFRLSQNGAITYSRNGQFHLDKEGFIINDQGMKLTGYLVDDTSGTVSPSTPQEIKISAADIAPVATGRSSGSVTPGIIANVNLDSRSDFLGTAATVGPPPTAAISPWAPTVPNANATGDGVIAVSPLMYNYSTAQSIYDSLGNPHTLTYYFVKTDQSGQWELHTTVDGSQENNVNFLNADPTLAAPQALGSGPGNPLLLQFNTFGQLTSVGVSSVASPALTYPLTLTPGVDDQMNITVGAGAPATITLAASPYPDAATLAADAQAQIDASAIGPGVLTVTVSGNSIAITPVVAGTTVNVADAGAVTGATAVFGGASLSAASIIPEYLQVEVDLDGVTADLQVADPSVPNNSADPLMTFNMNFDGSTQYGSQFGVNSLSQDGYSSGRLAGISVGADGTIQGRYTNGQTWSLGQVVLANFRNPNGLAPLGDNQWAETSESGDPLIGEPGSASLGAVQSNSIEESNVDMTSELVAMITQQRNYQANAQSIKTQDQIMNTIVNLR